MPESNPEALNFLLSRRSRPAKTLGGPTPDRDTLSTILTAAARSPDHGALEPWRFIVLGPKTLGQLAEIARERAPALGIESERVEKGVRQFSDAELAIAVISSPKPSVKIPKIEQIYSAGAVCLALLNAALASGWGANWLTGWACYDREFMAQGLNLARHESVAGFIHIGTETATPAERPRPDLAGIIEWRD
ncbi:MAG: nitroreductase [Rhodobacter sp.]|nr:nitroreductase [Rhodobacter sp.]MCY4169782.1 nitroreductase [Rhodobacter sp.]MCY4243561.1 nitroreductase [Rhodobacter sp.]